MYEYHKGIVSVEGGCHWLGKRGPRNLEVALADVADIDSGYVDDILIGTRRDDPAGSTRDLILKHEREVRLVMEQLLKHQLIASYNKAQLFRAFVEFCGHLLPGRGYEGRHPESSWRSNGGYAQRLSQPYGGSRRSQTTTRPTTAGMQGSWLPWRTY